MAGTVSSTRDKVLPWVAERDRKLDTLQEKMQRVLTRWHASSAVNGRAADLAEVYARLPRAAELMVQKYQDLALRYGYQPGAVQLHMVGGRLKREAFGEDTDAGLIFQVEHRGEALDQWPPKRLGLKRPDVHFKRLQAELELLPYQALEEAHIEVFKDSAIHVLAHGGPERASDIRGPSICLATAPAKTVPSLRPPRPYKLFLHGRCAHGADDYHSGLADLLSFYPATRSAVRRRALIARLGPAIEAIIREELNRPGIRIAIVPHGSTLRGNAKAKSDLDFSIYILSGLRADEWLIPGEQDRIRARVQKLFAGSRTSWDLHGAWKWPIENFSGMTAGDFRRWGSGNPERLAESIDDDDKHRTGWQQLFLPALFGDEAQVERARRNAVRFIARQKDPEALWAVLQRNFDSEIVVEDRRRRESLHLEHWLRDQGVTRRSLQRFNSLVAPEFAGPRGDGGSVLARRPSAGTVSGKSPGARVGGAGDRRAASQGERSALGKRRRRLSRAAQTERRHRCSPWTRTDEARRGRRGRAGWGGLHAGGFPERRLQAAEAGRNRLLALQRGAVGPDGGTDCRKDRRHSRPARVWFLDACGAARGLDGFRPGARADDRGDRAFARRGQLARGLSAVKECRPGVRACLGDFRLSVSAYLKGLPGDDLARIADVRATKEQWDSRPK